LWAADIRRFGYPHQDTHWIRKRTIEAYGKHYALAWPHEEYESARPCRQSPLYNLLRNAGASFGEKLGWERPNWFADTTLGETPEDAHSFARSNWFNAVGREHLAARKAAVLFDQSSFAKFSLKGPGAVDALNWICAGNIDKAVGTLTYTQMLNDKGGIECDLTVSRVAPDEFYIVTGTGFATHNFNWINRNIPKGLACELTDVTASLAVLSLMGPEARTILEKLTQDDMSNEAFKFTSVRIINIASCAVRALRITYVGECGWELHVPVDDAVTVYTALMQTGKTHGLINAGYRAIGYRPRSHTT